MCKLQSKNTFLRISGFCIVVFFMLGQGSVTAASFADNFDNGIYADTDDTPAFWRISRGSTISRYILEVSENIDDAQNGRLSIVTNQIQASGIITPTTPDFNFFNTPVLIDLKGISIEAEQFLSSSLLHVGLYSRNDRTIIANHMRLAMIGDRAFIFTVKSKDGTTFPISLKYDSPEVPERVTLYLDSVEYRITFYFAGGGLFFAGEHGMTLEGWANGTGDAALFIGASSTFSSLTTVGIDSIEVSDQNTLLCI